MYSCDDTLAGGLPHSDIHGSTPARGSPWLFAACHVLHRLLVPRHPPNALLSLETLVPGPKSGDPPCTETILSSHRPISPSVNPGNQPSTKRTATAQSRNHSCSAHNSSPLNTAPSLDAETSGQTSRWSRPETHQNLIHIYKDLPPDRHHRTRSDDHPRAGAPNLETPPASQLHIETINTDCFRFSAIPTRTTPSPKWWR